MFCIKQNYQMLMYRLAEAARKSNRDPAEIKLVAVTKNITKEKIMEAYNLGINNFGENRVQEAMQKIDNLPKDINWHFIGHLQTNKSKYIVPRFMLLHSLDRLRLVRTLNNHAKKENKVFPALVQVNIAREKTKYGVNPEEVEDFLVEAAKFPYIKIKGLMTIAPFLDNPGDVRPYFRQLYSIYKSINIEGIEMKFLSMGMTNDFEVAVEEGANLIRIGTAIFKGDA